MEFSLNDFPWIHQIQSLLTKSRNSIVTKAINLNFCVNISIYWYSASVAAVPLFNFIMIHWVHWNTFRENSIDSQQVIHDRTKRPNRNWRGEVFWGKFVRSLNWECHQRSAQILCCLWTQSTAGIRECLLASCSSFYAHKMRIPKVNIV